MPSAKDLLQQADALMRSNRSVGVAGGEDTVPVLTDVAAPGRTAQGGEIPVLTNAVRMTDSDRFVEAPAGGAEARSTSPAEDDSLLPLSEMPAVPHFPDDDSIIALRKSDKKIDLPAGKEADTEERPKWLEADLLDAQSSPPRMESDFAPAVGAAPADARADTGDGDDRGQANEPQPALLAPLEPQPQPEPGLPFAMEGGETATQPQPGDTRSSAEEVAETVYFQVIQSLDLYTERALQQHLREHLPPIIERASRELLSTLNENLGALMRRFVADAIEKQLGVRPKAQPPRSA